MQADTDTMIHNKICEWFLLNKGDDFDRNFGETWFEFVDKNICYENTDMFENGTEFVKKLNFSTAIIVDSTAEYFIKKFICPNPKGIKVVVEKEIISNAYTVGFADVVIEFQDEINQPHSILIEIKSSLEVIAKDINSVVRQIKKYRSKLKNLKQSFLIYRHKDSDYQLDEDYEKSCEKILNSENINFIEIQDVVSESIVNFKALDIEYKNLKKKSEDERKQLKKEIIKHLEDKRKEINHKFSITCPRCNVEHGDPTCHSGCSLSPSDLYFCRCSKCNTFLDEYGCHDCRYSDSPNEFLFEKNQKSENNCFIATACFGSNSEEVILFKKFRDQKLIQFKLGKLFIESYYKFSPQIANLIKNNSTLRVLTKKIIVNPAYIFIKKIWKELDDIKGH